MREQQRLQQMRKQQALAAAGKPGHKRGGSFGLGGGLQGLTRPKGHLNYNTPPSSSSSGSSPYHPNLSAAMSSASSYRSYDTMLSGPGLGHHSPSHRHSDPFTGSPVTPMGAFQHGPPPLHPAIRPQFGPIWQHDYQAPPLGFAQGEMPPEAPTGDRPANSQSLQAAPIDVNFSPPSPITAGVLAASPTLLQQPPSLITSPMTGPFSTPMEDEPEEELGSGSNQSPAEQLRQQLRRISDPPLPSSYSVPHPAIKQDLTAHAPVSPQIPVPMPSSAQAAAPKSQQSEPDLHQPALRSQPDLSAATGQTANSTGTQHHSQQHHALPQHDSLHPPLQRATAGRVRELADVPPDSTALLEQMMVNLRKASENIWGRFGESGGRPGGSHS
jgi:hypothetical protein